MMRVGFVGLGAMGLPMARNLQRAGLLTQVWNRTADKARRAAQELQCTAAASIATLTEQCDAIVLCVSADQDVLDMVQQILPAATRGTLVIDCSTVSASTAQSAYASLRVKQVDFLDCPVSGGVEGARDATLAVMAGGDLPAFERAQPILRAMGKTITYFGASGAGQAAKATNQIMCAGIIQAVAEAMAFAKAQGLPLDKLVDTLGKGAGSSWYFVNRAPNMIREEFPAGFRVRLHAKDLRICQDMAAQFSVQLPVVERMLQEYGELMSQGFADEDISAIFRLKTALFQH